MLSGSAFQAKIVPKNVSIRSHLLDLVDNLTGVQSFEMQLRRILPELGIYKFVFYNRRMI